LDEIDTAWVRERIQTDPTPVGIEVAQASSLEQFIHNRDGCATYGIGSADPSSDGIVDLEDFAIMAKNWLCEEPII
jgi:hypothetical protein